MGVTLKSIAAAPRVSIGTVNRVMYNRNGVKDETGLLAVKAAKELEYKSNMIGKALVAQKNPLKIGIITNASRFYYFVREVWRGVETGGPDCSAHRLYALLGRRRRTEGFRSAVMPRRPQCQKSGGF